MELQDALGIAIQHEHRVRDHYTQGAQEILDPHGKRVFETLAREEQGHVDYLESRLVEWNRTGRLTTPELPTVLPAIQFVEAAKAKLEKEPTEELAVQSEMELLKVALELERTTSAFYQTLVDTLSGTHKQLFARFLEIEQGHLLIVQAEIDALAGHGHWFDFMEFDLEAG